MTVRAFCSRVPMARTLDHCVLPTGSLATARERLLALGFIVAPDAAHPFGTGNCCVFFQNGSYLEPLSVIDSAAASLAAEEGNVFVARDAAFRAALGDEGFSAVVLGTHDADADHERFVATGASGGQPLEFSRPFRNADGTEAMASFRLAFATPEPAAPCFFFTCQRVNALKVDRAALEAHANGVTGIRRIVMLASAPEPHIAFLQHFSGQSAQRSENGVDVRLANADLSAQTPDAFEATYGVVPQAAHIGLNGTGLAHVAIVFEVPTLGVLRDLLATSQAGFFERMGRIVVPTAAGQGALFIFEEISA